MLTRMLLEQMIKNLQRQVEQMKLIKNQQPEHAKDWQRRITKNTKLINKANEALEDEETIYEEVDEKTANETMKLLNQTN